MLIFIEPKSVANKVNSVIHRIKIYPVDKAVGFPDTYPVDIENITRWREDMNFMFEWQEQYLTSERSERVGYCSCHENIKFISSS